MTTYEHAVLGCVRIVHSMRSRRITLSIRVGGEIRLTLPPGTKLQEAIRFLDEKTHWALRALERMRTRYPVRVLDPTFSTRNHTLHLEPDACDAPVCRVRDGVIRVGYPIEMRYDEPQVQLIIREGVEQAWRMEAKAILPDRVAYLCRKYGFTCGRVTLRNSRTRWGSCSPKDDLSLSIHLMKLSDELIDYIILHELCHTRHKNHGEKFYALLNRLTAGEHLRLRRELKEYTTRW